MGMALNGQGIETNIERMADKFRTIWLRFGHGDHGLTWIDVTKVKEVL